jgi:hypothetical protein
MGARQSFYVESLGESSTTSSDWQNKLSLSFTPDANADYFVSASAGFTNSSGTDNHVGWVTLYHVEADTVLSEQSVQRQEASSPQDYFPFFTFARLSFGASPAEQTIMLAYNSSHAGDTTKIKDARLLAIKADAADQYATNDAIANNGGDINYQTRTILTFTPATTGDYLVLACCSLSADVNAAEAKAQLNYVTGATTFGDKLLHVKDDVEMHNFAWMEKLNLANSSQTFRLEWKSVGGELAWIGYARIAALRLDRFDNHYFASNQSVQNTTSNTDTDFLTLTQTPLALQHAIIAVAHCNSASTTVTGYLNLHQGSTIQEWNRESPGAAGYFSAGLAQRATLAAVATAWKWRARAETAGTTVNVGNLAIAVLQLEATPAASARRRYMAVAA